MAYQVPPDVRSLLDGLASAVLPLDSWTKLKGAPKLAELIPQLSSVPWRAANGSSTLTAATLKFIPAFEAQFDNEPDYTSLAARWNALRSNPLKYFAPAQGTAAGWRNARGLDPQARFGVLDGKNNNFPYVGSDASGAPFAMSRNDFYAACWAPLKQAYVASGKPTLSADLLALAMKLASNGFPPAVWSATPVSAQQFMNRFGRDLLIACLGQRNVGLAGVWQRAVLIEAAENRHVGNAYDPVQVKDAQDKLVKAMP